MSAVFDAADVQGNIVRGYRKPRVRHLVLEVADRIAARRWLADITSGNSDTIPQITTEAPWTAKPDICFNIGLTYDGLRALGTPDTSLATFPTEFVEGMNARALKLGDAGPSAPENWQAPFNNPKRVHLIATIYADEAARLDNAQKRILASREALRLLGTRDGAGFNGDYVHFGYRDNLTQPRFAEVHDPDEYADGQPMAPLGTVLLGYPTNFEGLLWRVPQPEPLGRNGSFNAFRVLAQDVVGFEAYLDTAATELLGHPDVDELLPPGAEAKIGDGLSRRAALREVVAANMCGRWRNGVPLALSPDTPLPSPAVDFTDFDYAGDSRCPYGAHIRRANPRGGKIVQRVANNSRRLIRRGMPYGPAYDPAKPDDPTTPEPERGLLGNFIGANLGAQFEAMSCDWLNLGLQDPRVTGSNDPLLGANDPETSWFDLPLKSGATIKLRGLPRFVRTRGGAYTFLPSLSAIRFLGALIN
ncbi:MAG: Deferrochelatase/peroxidase EfeB [Bradyrhizobium sp.]|nr:Deferrochelatase/peroxidase EfeB [Bradyrhizobium sp.]